MNGCIEKSLNVEIINAKNEIDIESRKLFPSPYVLESKSKYISNLLRNDAIKNSFPNLIYYIRKLECYSADIGGILNHDYSKENKRYRSKWLDESHKLFKILDNIV